MTLKQRSFLWTTVFGFGVSNLIQQDPLTALVILGLAAWGELQVDRAELERYRRERAEEWTRHYVVRLNGGKRKRPARVIEMSNYNGNEAA